MQWQKDGELTEHGQVLKDKTSSPSMEWCKLNYPDLKPESVQRKWRQIHNNATTATRIEKMLTQAGFDSDDLGSIKQVKLNEYQMMSKDENGEPQVSDLNAMSFVMNPKWAEEPTRPLVQQAKPTIIKSRAVPKPTGKYKTAVIFPDPQIGFRRDIETGELDGFHDEGAMDIALQITAHLSDTVGVSKVVNLGDFLDFPEWGTFEQEPAFQMTTQASVDRGHMFLAEQKAVAPHAEISLIEGNHDRRLQKAIVRNDAAAFGLKQARLPESWSVLSVPHLLRLDELNVEYIEGYPAGAYWINDRLKAIHGRIVRSGGSTARAVAHDERVSTIFGHIHRIENHYKTVNTRKGGRTNQAISPGCLCKIDGTVPSAKGSTDLMGRPIKSYENWQQGLAVVTYQDGDKPFAIEQVFINGRIAFFRGRKFVARG